MALLEYGHPRKALTSQAVWFGSWLVVTIIGAVLNPDRSGHGTHQQLGLPPCPSVLLFDRPCPGCGLTTSWTAFIHGHFAEAFHSHPLGPILYVAYAVSALIALFGYFKGGRLNTDTKGFNRTTTVAVVIFVVFGAARMALTPHFGTQAEHIFANYAK